MSTLPTHVRVDWFRLLDDLKRAGNSLYDIEGKIEIPKSTLIGYKQGSEPKHCDGEKLITFWCKVTCRHRTEIPLVRVTLSAATAK